MIMVVCLRIGTLVTILLAYSDALNRSTRPWLSNLLLATVLIESAALIVSVLRRGEYRAPGWIAIETALALAYLLLEPWYVPVSARSGTWVGWAPGFAVNVCIFAAVGCANRRQTLTVTVLLSAAYFTVTYPEVGHGTTLSTVVANIASYGVFAIVARAMISFVRRFAVATDAAREDAIRAGRQVEIERHRRLLHDPASLLRYLADPNLDPHIAGAVRTQALAEANRIRAYLADPALTEDIAAAGTSTTSLVGAVRTAAAGFTDLPQQLLLDLADGVPVGREAAHALTAATTTVLLNVRQHAGPVTYVIIHADRDPGKREWEISICDDGRGFDAAGTKFGYGLTQLVRAALIDHGITTRVRSRLGAGTTVTLRGVES